MEEKQENKSVCECGSYHKCDAPPLGYYKIYKDSQDIQFHTGESACFDVAAYLKDGEKIKAYTDFNTEITLDIFDGELKIPSGYRVLIPSGIILDIPNGYSVRTHPRSGTGWKLGLCHPHDEGIIDSDYFHQLFLVFFNMTKAVVYVNHEQRLAQLELVKNLRYEIREVKDQPSQKTDRVGGFGSTGK